MVRSLSRSCQLPVPGMITSIALIEKFDPMMVDRRNDSKAQVEGFQMTNLVPIGMRCPARSSDLQACSRTRLRRELRPTSAMLVSEPYRFGELRPGARRYK
jgi:hypothetical protein